MEKQRTTDLFRFVTLRSPESITTGRKELGFVKHTALTYSHFLQYIGDAAFDAEIAAAITSFVPVTMLESLESPLPDIREFALWLSQNKWSLDSTILAGKIPAVLPTADQVLGLWDNVYYSILTRGNLPMRQSFLELLIALNFIDKYADYLAADPDDEVQKAQETADLRRLANAKVLINKALAAKKNNTGPATATPPRRKGQKQENQLKAKIAAQNADIIEGIRKELRCFEKRYIKDYNTALQAASLTYEASVETLVEAYLADHPDLKGKAETEYQLPEDLVPTFSFTYDLPFSEAYATGKLSEDTLAYIQKRCLSGESVKTALESVQDDLQQIRRTASGATRKQYKTMLINGVLTQPAVSDAKEYTLTFKKQPGGKDGATNYSVLLLLDTGYNGGFFTASDFNVEFGGSTNTENQPTVISNSDNSIFAEFFLSTPIGIGEGAVITIDATLTLNNGKQLKIDRQGIISTAPMSGMAIGLADFDETAALYGVNRIGIADYRRVEQELCCYIPGEVSHIENIMAREYKERTTRDLTRSEITTETSTEREAEDTTDTTSTTRHEMSSEVAEVIDRDRKANLGFSTAASGSYGVMQYSGTASGDFTFGQSTSDSNKIAQSYAEDVTRRALERIVQKTSEKRTSKMLREFEENNKHGFDNREGDQHVTGIFRWIDKVYKNRIFNYHKRLMYEFMVPEPARFYKEAIIIEAEETDAPNDGDNTTGSTTLIKPQSPADYGVPDSTRLTRDNYTTIAGYYGVSLDPPQNEFSNVSETYPHDIGNTDSAKSFSHNSLRVTDDYQCTQIVGNVSYHYKAKVNPKAYIKIAAATAYWERVDIHGEGNSTGSFVNAVGNLEGAISVGINTKKIVSLSLTIEAKCQLKAEVFERWQSDAYADIMRAYEDQLKAFNEAQDEAAAANAAAAAASGEGGAIERNPLFNSAIVNTELKRLCIEMLTRPFGIEQGRDFYQPGDCNVPELKLSADLDVYSSRVKFFEQAFDWDIMSQRFYPYYWAKRCDWKALFQSQDGNDYIFQSFLQSGMGRVVVPVREGFEDAVVYFMETGEVWNGTGMTFDTDDELYLSIIDELAQPAGYVEGAEWETTVPSSLTIVQARSALLDEEGLPCCHTAALLPDEPTLKADTNILKWKAPAEDPILAGGDKG